MAEVAETPVTEVKSVEKEVDEVAPTAKEAVVKEVAAAAAGTESVAALSDEDKTKLDRAIIRQMEYYFGDANLNRDKFLLEQIGKDEAGWVPLSVMLTFKRLSSLSADPEVIVDAVLKSDEGLLEVSEDRQKLRRHPERPIPEHNEERRKEVMSRTAYAKGFPLETSMADLIEFFAPYEKVAHINMRKYLDKPTKSYKFKGSVFVTFEKKEQMQDFVEKPKVVYQERELLRKMQEKYLEEKREELKAKAKKKEKAAEESKVNLPKGAILHFDGTAEDVTRELLREAVEKVEGDFEVAYVDFSKGDKQGYFRFQDENAAVQFVEKLQDSKLQLKEDVQLAVRVLADDEETAYLTKTVEQMRNRRNNFKNKGGHHHGNRKRRGGDNHRNDGKKKKADD